VSKNGEEEKKGKRVGFYVWYCEGKNKGIVALKGKKKEKTRFPGVESFLAGRQGKKGWGKKRGKMVVILPKKRGKKRKKGREKR